MKQRIRQHKFTCGRCSDDFELFMGGEPYTVHLFPQGETMKEEKDRGLRKHQECVRFSEGTCTLKNMRVNPQEVTDCKGWRKND